MDIRIGVTQSPRELEIELPEGADAEKLAAEIEDTLASEKGMLWLTDRRGRRVGVPAAKVAYVELDSSHDERRVGFGATVK